MSIRWHGMKLMHVSCKDDNFFLIFTVTDEERSPCISIKRIRSQSREIILGLHSRGAQNVNFLRLPRVNLPEYPEDWLMSNARNKRHNCITWLPMKRTKVFVFVSIVLVVVYLVHKRDLLVSVFLFYLYSKSVQYKLFECFRSLSIGEFFDSFVNLTSPYDIAS